jgi:hypothetical protein
MKKLTAAASVIALAMSFATSANACGETPCEPPPEEETKGNNGWGNGIDGTNPGSDEGPASQVSTKQNESVWDKFDGKFEGR